MRILAGLLLAAFTTTAVADDGPFHFEFEELAPGVWAGVRDNGPRFPVMGNVTFVIGENGVLVYDGGGLPAMAEQTIEKIRSLTNKPVTHVVISHWHGDHVFGVYRYAEEFANVEFLAHTFTRDVMNSTKLHYIDRQISTIEERMERFRSRADTGKFKDGTDVSEAEQAEYATIVADADVIIKDFKRARMTPPTIVMDDSYSIDLGDRTAEILYLGDANTAGDIVMWLPEERIVATGDIVVMPSPYAFNVPPRAWAKTLENINALDYEILVPGHGATQRNTDYVDLIIESAESIADQRDKLLADGKSIEETQAALDFSAFEERYTHGDEYVRGYYEAYFEVPFRAAAMKALTGGPMVDIEPPIAVPFTDERWAIEARVAELVDHLGQSALQLRGGAAMLTGVDAHNSVVEFDIAVSEERGFAGLIFRKNDNDYEHFYIRPHQSGKPDANQYTPVFNNVSGWQLYHGEEYASPTQYRFDEWMHVKIVFAATEADVYIDSDEPVLHIDDLKLGDVTGQIGVHSSGFSTAHFANFQYSPLAEAYEFPSNGPQPESAEPGYVTEWEVSEPIDSSKLSESIDMAAFETNWSVLQTEDSGIANLARVNGLGEAADTVFTCIRINADQAGTKRLQLGYSDKAKVFLNGKAVYEGDNTYMTRDYRYLGTIGLFDSVYLPLEEGENEVWIAVTEAFGGWGITAQFASLDGITLLEPR